MKSLIPSRKGQKSSIQSSKERKARMIYLRKFEQSLNKLDTRQCGYCYLSVSDCCLESAEILNIVQGGCLHATIIVTHDSSFFLFNRTNIGKINMINQV